jgi:hypothetical protein
MLATNPEIAALVSPPTAPARRSKPSPVAPASGPTTRFGSLRQASNTSARRLGARTDTTRQLQPESSFFTPQVARVRHLALRRLTD